ncbi:MAG: NlpC/P60 family protein [Hyphomicrobiaceae bacterium]
MELILPAATPALRHHPRAEVVAAARSWLATPYHHQASVRGVGCDCLGLVRGVYRDLYGREPEDVPAYSRDWTETATSEPLLTAALRHFRPADDRPPSAGDLLVFRFRAGSMAKHLAIATDPQRMIHAVETAAVREVALSPWWRRRLAGTFSFPGSID